MQYRKLMLAGAAMAAVSAFPAQSSIIDNPHFKVQGLVIVWGADSAGNSRIVSDFIIDDATGAGDSDLIGDDVYTVVTGSLTPTPDAASAGYSAFEVDGASTDVNSDGVLDASDVLTAFDASSTIGGDMAFESSFYVASNVAFAIDAVAAEVGTPVNFGLDDIDFDLGVTVTGTDGTTTFGGNAQDPGGSFPAVATLNDMATSTNVYTGALRTAQSAGSIVGQSVRFDATYTLGGTSGYDLSMGNGEIEAAVTYTVYVP